MWQDVKTKNNSDPCLYDRSSSTGISVFGFYCYYTREKQVQPFAGMSIQEYGHS